MSVKIIIFDLDGTLLNTLNDLYLSTNYALNSLNLPKRTIEEIKSFVGNGVEKLIERAVPNGLNNEKYKKCLEIFKKHYKDNMYLTTKPYKGIIETLKIIKEKNIKTAILSNKFDTAVKELSEKYFNNLIDFALGENKEKGIYKKPSCDGIKYILEKFNLKPEDAILIGDSEVDIQTAKNSSVEYISVLWGYKNKDFLIQNGAKNMINSIEELLNYI